MNTPMADAVAPPPPPPPAALSERAGRSNGWLAHALVIVLVCITVYWIGLGARPFASSEGHRVVPGWTMLDSGDWLHVRMFGLTYLRKPPGMPWAIAASSAIFGQNEFAARLPSALCSTLMALVAYAFSRRWFPSRAHVAALGAGLAQALTPLFWNPGRSAEIEALNNFGTQLALLAMIDLLLRAWMRRDTRSEAPSSSRARIASSVVSSLVLSLGLIIAVLAKGPATAPCIAGVLIGAVIAARSIRPVLTAWLWIAFALAAAALFPIGRGILAANQDPNAVTQGVSDFMSWSVRDLGSHATLIPVAFLSAIPTSLVLLFPWGRDARSELESSDPTWAGAAHIARILAFAWIASALIFLVLGVTNPRYLMPAAVLLPPLVAYVLRGCAACPPPFAVAGFTDARKSIARTFMLGKSPAWAALLTVAAMVGALLPSIRPGTTPDGRAAGALISTDLDPDATLWADDLIEARPDALLYAQRAASAAGHRVTIRWAKHEMASAAEPLPSTLIVLRTDKDSSELARYRPLIERGRLFPIRSGSVGQYEFTIYQTAPPTPPVPLTPP